MQSVTLCYTGGFSYMKHLDYEIIAFILVFKTFFFFVHTLFGFCIYLYNVFKMLHVQMKFMSDMVSLCFDYMNL